MPFVPKKQAFNAHINEVVLGVGDKATAIGGQNVLPFHTFDAEIKNAPKIGVELTDLGMAEYTMPGEKAFYAGCTTVAALISWWYNNSYTQAALAADEVYEQKKNSVH